MLAPKQEERQSLIPQADNEKSAKRNRGSSDDSDAGNDKPDAQRMKGEHGAVARGKLKRSNRWGHRRQLFRKRGISVFGGGSCIQWSR